MLIQVEVRVAVSRHPVRPKSWFHDTMSFFHQAFGQQESISRKAWGMLGFALTELMDIAETARDSQVLKEIVTLTKNWCNIALGSRTPVSTVKWIHSFSAPYYCALGPASKISVWNAIE